MGFIYIKNNDAVLKQKPFPDDEWTSTLSTSLDAVYCILHKGFYQQALQILTVYYIQFQISLKLMIISHLALRLKFTKK